MISFMTKKYIHKRVINNTISSDYVKILKEIEKKGLFYGTHIKFSWYFSHREILNARILWNRYILLNPEWATRLILYNDDNLKNALNITIGHELTHGEKELGLLKFCKDKRLIHFSVGFFCVLMIQAK